jgi:hypothetical protein
VDGLELTTTTNDCVDPPLEIGDEVVVFLTTMPGPGYLVPDYGAYGILRVRDGVVSAANETVQQLRPLTFSSVVDLQAEVQKRLRDLQRKVR